MRLLLAPLLSCAVFGQPYVISTVAGGGLPSNISGTSAALSNLYGVALDAAGDTFFTSGNTVLRLDARTGILTLFAGNGIAGFSGDNGPATSAQLYQPEGVAVDSGGNVYIADFNNGRVRKVSNGVITTVAGGGSAFPGDDGLATDALLGPMGVAVDSKGNLYIADGNPFARSQTE